MQIKIIGNPGNLLTKEERIMHGGLLNIVHTETFTTEQRIRNDRGGVRRDGVLCALFMEVGKIEKLSSGLGAAAHRNM